SGYRRHALERFGVVAIVRITDRRDRGFQIDLRIIMVDHYQRRGVLIRQRPEEHRIDDAEDRRVGADAQRQRDDCDDGEPWFTHQRAKPETQVLPECLHNPPKEPITMKQRARRFYRSFFVLFVSPWLILSLKLHLAPRRALGRKRRWKTVRVCPF